MPDPKANFVRLSRPSQPVVTLAAEPTEHGAKPASTGNFARLSRPAQPVVTLAAERVESVMLVLEVEAVTGSPGSARDRLVGLLQAVDEYERALGGTGVECRVEAEKGRLTLKVVPNDPSGAEARLNKVADLIAEAMPETPVRRQLVPVGAV